MSSMLCDVFTDLWHKFSYWVTVEWSYLVFIITVCIFALLGGLALVSFIKGPKYNKEKKPFKWGSLVVSILMFGVMAVLLIARF